VKENQKKNVSSNLEFFRIREKEIPVEGPLKLKGTVDSFEWEPKGSRFAVLTVPEGSTPTSSRRDVSFYDLKNKKLTLLKTFEKKPITNLYWSPKGNFVVMAGLKGFNGTLEFYNVNELETMATDEHFMATHVTWDPTGRYLATYVSAWEHQVENGYNIWTFQGKLLKHVGKDKFYQFFWRPRPPSLVSAAQEEKLHKELLPTYVKKYQEIDANRRADAARVEDEKRKKIASRLGEL